MGEYLKENLSRECTFFAILLGIILLTYVTAVIMCMEYKRRTFVKKIVISILRTGIIALCGSVMYMVIKYRKSYIIPYILMLVTVTRYAFWVEIRNKQKGDKTRRLLWGITIIAFILETCFWLGAII